MSKYRNSEHILLPNKLYIHTHIHTHTHTNMRFDVLTALTMKTAV